MSTSTVTYLDDWDHLRHLPRHAHVERPSTTSRAPRSSQLFVQPRRAVIDEEQPRPTRGWRGYLADLGMAMRPSTIELRERNDARAASRQWLSSHGIAVMGSCSDFISELTANALASIFERQGGSGIVVEQLSKVRARTSEEISAWCEHQSMLFRMRLTRMKNDDCDPRQREVLSRMQQLVVASTTQAVHVESAAYTLDQLRGGTAREQMLARAAVVVLVVTDPRASEFELSYAEARLGQLTNSLVVVPFDRATVADGVNFDALGGDAQRAWLSAAAAIANVR